MECQARAHGYCRGRVSEHSVGLICTGLICTGVPDTYVDVSLCSLHFDWLMNMAVGAQDEVSNAQDEVSNVKGEGSNVKGEGEAVQLVMYGKSKKDALENDLFRRFQDRFRSTSDMYTVIRIEYQDKDKEYGDDTWFMFKGNNIEHFEKFLSFEGDKSVRITQRGMFHFNGVTVSEIDEMSNEYDLEGLNTTIDVFYKPLESYNKDEHLGYESEAIPERVRLYFTNKFNKIDFDNFETCVEFIRNELSYIITSHISKDLDMKRFYELFRLLTKALLEDDDDTITEMDKSGLITDALLWITYVHANHKLYYSCFHKKKLKENERLIKLFEDYCMINDLLTVAISGERVRVLDQHQRSHNDILYENEYVVRRLVPLYVKTNDILNMNNPDTTMWKTPLQYWHYYSNTTIDNSPFATKQTFDKNEEIHRYLEEMDKEHKPWYTWCYDVYKNTF